MRYYDEARTPDQKITALTGLGYVQDEDLIERLLKFATSDDVKNQDILFIFLGLQSNRRSRRSLWNFVRENWYTIHGKYSRSIVLFENIVRLSIELLSSEDDIKEIEAFFFSKNCKDFEIPLQQSIENVRANAAWVNRDAKDVEDWLKRNGYLR